MTAEVPGGIQLHRLKKIEVVVHAEDIATVRDVITAAGIAGWTMIRDVAGLGHGGFHQGRTIFSDRSGLVMFIGVAAPDLLSEAVKGLGRVFETRPGVMFLSDVEVLRSDYFAGSRNGQP
jgi:nitrogen regulatory protein PII